MSCYLRISGKKFDATAFAHSSSMPISTVYMRGEPKFPNTRFRRKNSISGVNVLVSGAWFDNLGAQIRGAKRFCNEHRRELQKLWRIPGVEYTVMDFGIGQRNVVVQVDTFPPDLLEAMGKLKIELMISTYPISKPGKSRKDILASRLESRAERIEAGRARTNTWRRG